MNAVACLGSSKSCSCSMVMFEEGEDAIYCNYIVESELVTDIEQDGGRCILGLLHKVGSLAGEQQKCRPLARARDSHLSDW